MGTWSLTPRRPWIATGAALCALAMPTTSSQVAIAADVNGECTPSTRVGIPGPITDPNGPYYHQVRIGTYRDGAVLGETLVAEHASVPDAIKLSKQRIAIYYVNGEVGSIYRGIWNGKKLASRTPITIDGVRGSASAVDPDVIRLANGTLRLAYFNGFGPPGPGQEHVMCIADSEDGVRFQSRGVIYRGQELTDPSLARDGGTWFLAISRGQQTIVARSMDGRSFEQVALVTVGGVPEIAADHGSLRLYVCGRNGVVELSGTVRGSTWTERTVVLRPRTCDPSVVVGTQSFVYKTFAFPKG